MACGREAAEASAALRDFLSSGELDAERQRHLQAVVGWKTSAAAGAPNDVILYHIIKYYITFISYIIFCVSFY